jgi:hypothetical protein
MLLSRNPGVGFGSKSKSKETPGSPIKTFEDDGENAKAQRIRKHLDP